MTEFMCGGCVPRPLIERLRDAKDFCGTLGIDICNEAADALEQTANLYDAELRHSEFMRKRVRQLEAALRKTITMAKMSDGTWSDDLDLELQAIETLIAGDTST